MQTIDRRKFLGIVGAGSAAAAAAAAGGAGATALLASAHERRFSFRAEGGLPARPLPAYATAVVEGNVDLEAGSGLVTTRVLAGNPEARSDIALPGLTRVVRITSASVRGSAIHLAGVVEDRSQLSRGESPRTSLVLDRSTRELRTRLAGAEISLPLV
jgi:hypothetical protein